LAKNKALPIFFKITGELYTTTYSIISQVLLKV